jgi:hypothetical protein
MNVKNEIPMGRANWSSGTGDPSPRFDKALSRLTARNP